MILDPAIGRRDGHRRALPSPPLAALLLSALLAAVACNSGDEGTASAADDPDGVPGTPVVTDEPDPTDRPAVTDEVPVTTPVPGGGETEPEPLDSPVTADGVVRRVDVIGIDGVVPFRADGRHADVLAGCSLIGDVRDACPLSVLPFIAQETATPSVDDVMGRVLVSHDWMGERFETLLRTRSEELLPLFGSVTSIVIGSTVRPSNYWTGTGGIQLDPAGLWLTIEEKANISIDEDFRAPFRQLLGFRNFWDVRIAGRSIYGRHGLEDTTERALRDIELPTMSLLFHELAHANDFLPPGAAPRLDVALTPNDALEGIFDEWLSPSLDARLPLNSDLLRSLARVRFRGETPTDDQGAVSGTVVGADMAADGASHFYSYHTIREDFANLFETLQMKRLFDADVHVAFTGQPEDPDNFGCTDLLVEWGVLNRLGDPQVRARAADVTRSIYGPDPTLDAFLADQQGTQRAMEVGIDYCTNLARDLPADAATRARVAPPTLEELEPTTPTHAERHAIADPRRRRR